MTIGNLCLVLALPVSIYSIFASKDGPKKAANLVTALVSLSVIMLIFAFVSDNFAFEYVYSYSSRSLPFVYKLSGLWAGLSGSLLFWLWLLVIFASIVSHKARASAVLQIVVVFFLITIIFAANPFLKISPVPPDGRGLNPLLQNIFMLFHPPALYLGYVGLSVPFAYVIAALSKKGSSLTDDIPTIRFWTILSWLCLTLGNLLGATWAYVELGWGGFWAWDPVENAGVMPWFTATAFLHSAIIQERRNMFALWNIMLVVMTFVLTIFGTFITRSGIIQSVHSFSDVTIGIYFIVFLTATILASTALILARRRQLASQNKLLSLVSKEGMFCLNNILFVFALIAILWGTMLPLFAELFTGQKLEVGPPFFNRVMAPIGIIILFLTGIGPLTSWKDWRKGLFVSKFLWPTVIAILACAIVFAFGVKKWFAMLVAAGSAFVILQIVIDFVSAVKSSGTFLGLFKTNPHKYGGFVVHLGVVLMFIGFAGSSYKSEHTFAIKKGERQAVATYEFLFNGLKWITEKESEGVVADLEFFEGAVTQGHLRPALFLHKNQPKPIAEVDFKMRPFKDIYLALASISEEGPSAELTLTLNPLISFLWLGGLIMVIGTIICILPSQSQELLKENEDL